jgi:exopolysaccharide production protein ExoQ
VRLSLGAFLLDVWKIWRISSISKDKASVWEKILTVTVLFLSTYAVVPLLRKQNGFVFEPLQGDIMIQALWAGIYTITFFLLIRHWRLFIRVAFLDKFIWLLLGLAFISIFWSGAPEITLRRCMALFCTTAFGVYLAASYSRQELLKLLLWALGACAVLSIVFALLLPAYGLHLKTYLAWRGVYENKNILGCFMALGSITWLLYTFSQKRGRLVGIAFVAIFIALLLLSKSITAYVVFIVILFSLLVYYLAYYRNIWAARPLAILAAAGLSIMLFNHLELVLATLGRDATLTGRTLIWQQVWSMLLERPWLGYGYSAFWLGWNGPSSQIWSVFPVISAHNGFLDLWLQLGLAGVLVFLASFLTNLFQAHGVLRGKNSLIEMFPLLFLLFILIYNITETAILVQNSLFWILYVAISIQLKINHAGR